MPLNPGSVRADGWAFNGYGVYGADYVIMYATNLQGRWVTCPNVEDKYGYPRTTVLGQDEDITLIAPFFPLNGSGFYRLDIQR
jgi:hypothetical protein